MSLDWVGISSIGKKVLLDDGSIDSAWSTPSGIIYRNGYSCKRLYRDENKSITYLIYNNISRSSLGKPLFESVIKLDDKVTFRTFNLNPSTVYRKVVENLELSLKGKLVGQRFFGLMTKDYGETMGHSNEEEASFDEHSKLNIVCDPIYKRQFSFKCVSSFGQPLINSDYEIKIGKIKCRLQPGYESIRSVKLTGDKYVDLHLQILYSDAGPLFKAYTLSNPIINSTSLKIKEVVKQAMVLLNVKSNKNWSAVEFYGLTRSDVLEVITKPISQIEIRPDSETCDAGISVQPCSSKNVKIDGVLQDILNIHRRNAGETSGLCKKSIKARNATIHKLVEFASFGDVKSMYIHLFFLCIYIF